MTEKLNHYVSQAPFNPMEVEELTPEQEKFYLASQWKMMWWRLRRHKLAVWAGIILLTLYVSILFSEFLAPYNLHTRNADFIFAPPQTIHFFHEGKFIGPFVYGQDYKLNMDILRREYSDNENIIQPLRFFCNGDKYEFWSLFESNVHLVCPAKGGTFYFLGTDRLGRDIWSRIIYGTRISLTVGLVGIILSFILGISIGGAAGYFGGWVDSTAQRAIEILRSIPDLP